MNVETPDQAVSDLAAAIGDPARARMLYLLFDGRARTATELALAAGVAPSTASVHLRRLQSQRLVDVMPQGRHRYLSLHGPEVGAALEALTLLAGATRDSPLPSTPEGLRLARTCYDHLAGALGAALLEIALKRRWIARDLDSRAVELTPSGRREMRARFGLPQGL